MLSFILTWVVSALGVLVTAWAVPGLAIAGVQSALIAAPLFGVVNAVVKPVLTVLTLPLTILSLGLFLFVVNAIAFGLVGYITPGFHVDGFFAALFGSVMLSIVSSVLDRLMAKFTGESSAIEQV